MTTRVIVAVPIGQHGDGVLVTHTTPQRAPQTGSFQHHVAPGNSHEFTVWDGQALHIEEI